MNRRDFLKLTAVGGLAFFLPRVEFYNDKTFQLCLSKSSERLLEPFTKDYERQIVRLSDFDEVEPQVYINKLDIIFPESYFSWGEISNVFLIDENNIQYNYPMSQKRIVCSGATVMFLKGNIVMGMFDDYRVNE